MAAPHASELCCLQGLPGGDVGLLEHDRDLVGGRIAIPAGFGELGNHPSADAPTDEIFLSDQVIDTDTAAVTYRSPDRVTPGSVVLDQITLDVADRPAHEMDDEGLRRVEAIRQRPLLGAGVGTFENLFPSLRTAEFDNWGVWDYAHSTIIEIAVEMGLPVAAMIVIAACVSIIILIRRALKSDGRDRAVLAAITGIAVLTYLHSMIDFSLQIPGYLILFGTLIGCGLAKAAGDQSRRKRRRAQEFVSFIPAIVVTETMSGADADPKMRSKAD